MKFLNDVDFVKNEAQNMVIQVLATAPASPVEGLVYFNSLMNEPFIWSGADWVSMTADQNYWQLTVETTGASQAYSIDINSGTAIDIDIDWGDGNVNNYTTTGIKSNTYALQGTYAVRISGSMTNGNIRQDSTGSFANAVKVKATSAIVGITGWANFHSTFYNTRITTCPADTFRIHTAVAANAFRSTFHDSSINIVPGALFRYNTAVSTGGFLDTFRATSLVLIPNDFFRYNTAVSSNGFFQTFYACQDLTTASTDLFRYNTAVSTGGFFRTVRLCNNLQMVADVFGDLSVITDRFTDKSSNFEGFFQIIAAFAGTQGIAPNLWDADYGSVMTIDVQPTTDWAVDDLITGQTSGATCTIISKVTATTYRVYKHRGTFTLGEIIGVTGDANKLADQGAAHPTFTFVPVRTDTFKGHDTDSLSNYNDIPNDWKGL